MISFWKSELSAPLPVTKIVDTVFFAAKSEAFLLQLADACAFTIRAFLEKKQGIDVFAETLAGHRDDLIPTNPDSDGLGWKYLAW